MPRGCPWYYVGSYSSDGVPGLSQNWCLYVARDGTGRFYIKAEDDEVAIEEFASPEELVGFVADFGDETLDDFLSTVCSLQGFGAVTRMIEFRFRDRTRLHF